MSTFPETLVYVSFILGLVTLGLTILNVLALYIDCLATLRAAPEESHDALATLRAQLLEEREALRQQTRELRAKKQFVCHTNNASRRVPSRQHPAHRGRPRSASRSFDNLQSIHNNNNNNNSNIYGLTYAEQTLGLHYQTVRDLWRKFKALERPFLVLPNDAVRAEQVHRGMPWGEDDIMNEKGVREGLEMHGEAGSGVINGDGSSSSGGDGNSHYAMLYQCGFVHRFIWWQSKKDVLKLADTVQAVMLRRMEREVTCMRMMVRQLRDGGDGPEDIMNPRFDIAGGGGGGLAGLENRSRGPTPMGLMRRPIGETYNVYESSDSGNDSGTRMKRRLDELDNNNNSNNNNNGININILRPQGYNTINANGPQQRPSSAGQRTGSYEFMQARASEQGRKQGTGQQHMRLADMINTRAPAPVVLPGPQQTRPRARRGCEGSLRMPPSAYEGRR